ncbi:NmrA family NAD(P)-binding protein [Chitinophagaceae bacterium LB-8]|uniref:NmrA family NAD(P)-binding protein n=1 Tax=Paraflavisolibacter caeni TaxID=2982496 RepID=A0A9X3B9V4_9BACT|nr:NmrA family NAD(P)-binding protein [Paraflavisolibacter caeni]MCU7551811.1 NmrA family NAD(P)-binding protein [Paraflavisolibacter caeni]
MKKQNQNKAVLLIGSSGKLGGMIARELIKKGVNLRLLLRPGSRKKLAEDIIEASEITENEANAFNNVYSVISAVQGGPETIINDQLRWLQAAKEAGVKRFIPSDYSFNFFNLEEGANINSDWRRSFALQAEDRKGNVEIVHILNGAFLDKDVLFGFLGAFNLEKGEAYLWGNGNEKMEVTTYADTAAYIAEAALDDDSLPDKLFFAGDSLNFHELVKSSEAGLGSAITIRKMGTLEDLNTEISQRMQTHPKNIFAWLPLMYWRAMLNGKGRLEAPMNERYPNVNPIGVTDYLRQTVITE